MDRDVAPPVGGNSLSRKQIRKADTDGDGLSDGEEMGTRYTEFLYII